MLTRRGFIGALAAIATAPRQLFARQQPTTLGLHRDGFYKYKLTYITREFTEPSTTGAMFDDAELWHQDADGSYVRVK